MLSIPHTLACPSKARSCVIVLTSSPFAREVLKGQAVCALPSTRDELTQTLGRECAPSPANDKRFWRAEVSGHQAKKTVAQKLLLCGKFHGLYCKQVTPGAGFNSRLLTFCLASFLPFNVPMTDLFACYCCFAWHTKQEPFCFMLHMRLWIHRTGMTPIQLVIFWHTTTW